MHPLLKQHLLPKLNLLPKLYLLPLQLMLRFPLLPPKGKGKVCNNRKKYIAWDHFEKVDIGKGHFKAIWNYCQKTYLVSSKGHGTANLLNHKPVCVKNPSRVTLKGQQTLAFQLKTDGEEGF